MRQRANVWMTCCAAALTTAACAPPPIGTAAANPPPAAKAAPPPAAHRKATDPQCTRATKVKISGNGTAIPSHLTIQRGGYLAVTDTSDRPHTLLATPDAGIVKTVVDLEERQVVQFPKPGTFVLTSKDPTHRVTIRVTVAGESGCAAPGPALTVTPDATLVPATLTIAATENFAIVNDSGTARSIVCTPDAGISHDNPRLAPGETQLLAIDKPGRYACTSATAKSLITITKP